MTIIEQERKERLEEILRQIDFIDLHDINFPKRFTTGLRMARRAVSDILNAIQSGASNGQP